MKFSALALAAILILSGCARNLASNNYVSSSTSGVVLEGVIVSVREVTVSDADRLGGNGAGALGGAAVGGIGGSTIGNGKGSLLAAVGGAIIGSVAGAVVQDHLSTSDGMEYIVKVNRQNIGSPKPEKSVKINANKKPSTATIDTDLKTELLSVVQGKDQIFASGQKVYIIYSDDRPRMTLRD